MNITLEPEIIGTIGVVPISNSLVLSIFTGLLLLTLGFLGVRRLEAVPSKIQNAIEFVVENILEFMTSVLGNEAEAKKFFPLIASIFLFILFNNWLGVLPGVGSIELRHTPFFRSANSDLNTTLALALISVIAIQLSGIQKLGFLRHISKFFVFSKGPVQFFVGILEFIAELAKILSFSFRLFGNIFAGEVLLLIVMTLVPLLAPVPFFGLELFVGFIQALVFAILTLIFLKITTERVEH